MKIAVKKGLKIIFLVYMAALLYFLLFAERNVYGTNGYNVHFLAEIRRYIKYRDLLGTQLVVQNLGGNIVGFLPFGFLLPQINQWFAKVWKTLFAATTFSLTVETVQLITGVGCFDVDDILLNALGGLLGYISWWCFFHVRKKYGKSQEEKKI